MGEGWARGGGGVRLVQSDQAGHMAGQAGQGVCAGWSGRVWARWGRERAAQFAVGGALRHLDLRTDEAVVEDGPEAVEHAPERR